MSCLTENTLIVKSKDKNKIVEALKSNNKYDSFKEVYQDDNLTLCVFDYNGEIDFEGMGISASDYYLETNYLDNDCYNYEGSLFKGIDKRIKQIKTILLNGLVFSKITNDQRNEIVKSIEYSC